MKRILSFIIAILLSVTGLSWAAVGSGTVWEYRTTATNDNLNGGGYDSTISGAGTDYSQQNAAVATYNNITCDQNSVTINSVSNTFTAAMVGNAIQFTNAGSHTAGFYFITTYISGTQVKLDRTPYTGAGTSSGGTARVGGALYLPTDALLEVMVSGNIVYVKNGTYSLTGAINIGTAVGTNTNQIQFIGYNSTRGDDPTGTNRPLIACGANQFQLGTAWRNKNLRITSARVGGTGFTGGTNSLHYNISVVQTAQNTSSAAFQPGGTSMIILGSFQATSANAVLHSSGATYYKCYFHDSPTGFSSGPSATGRIINSVFEGNTTDVLLTSTSGSYLFSRCVFYGAGTGISLAQSPIPTIVDNIFHSKTTAITDSATNNAAFIYKNLFYNNGTNGTNVTVDSTNITGSDPLFTNPSGADFSITTGSPAINAAVNIGNSGVTGTYKNNIGVDETQTATGGTKSWAY